MAEHRDGLGYYKTLWVAPDATEEALQLSYEMLCELPPEQRRASMAEIDRAYTILKNPASRQAYDRSETLPLKRRRATSRLNDPRLLAACVTLFIGILAFVWLPLYGSRFKTFETGDRLLDRSGFSFGVIVQSEEQHTFEGGVVAPAYLVKTAATGELRWFPMGDIQATCSKER